MLRGDAGTGYIRVDWFTPAGLTTWGDTRLTILGTDGYIEFFVDAKGVRYIDCKDVDLPYGRQLVDDVLNRTETAMAQAHCFLATELALLTQQQAARLSPGGGGKPA